MSDPIITDLGALTAVGQGYPKQAKSTGSHTVTVSLLAAGAITYVGVLMGSNDNLNWSAVAALSATGTDSATATASVSTDYAYWRHDVTTLTGVGVLCRATMNTDQSSSFSGVPVTFNPADKSMPAPAADAVRGVAVGAPLTRSPMSAISPLAFAISGRPFDSSAAALTFATPSLPTTTSYYIDPVAGNDSTGSGTLAAPWASVAKLVGLNTGGAAANIYIAADGTSEHAVTLAQYNSRTLFTYNCADNLSGASASAKVVVRPYYPRGALDGKTPTIRYYCETVAGDWTQETSIQGGKVWSIGVSGSVDGSNCYALFGSAETVGLNPKAARGAAYGHDPLNLYDANQYSLALSSPTKLYVYVPDGSNPITYYGKVRIGGLGVFNSSWNGMRYFRITGIKFELCSAVWSLSTANNSTGASVGLEIDNCVFNKAWALNYANRTTNATALEGEWSVHDNTFTSVPCVGIRNQPCTGTSGNAVQWRLYRNRINGANLSTSDKAWFYNQAVGGTFYRAWANYGYDCRNGTGGNSIDGAMLYADLSSANTEFVGNVAEYCGVAYQSNNAINCTIVGNIAVDCVKLAQITASTDGAVTTMSTRCSHNTWLYTGRRTPQTGPNVPMNGPIVAWNDKAAASGASYKWARLEILNNALSDLSGQYSDLIACRYTGSQAITAVVGGFAIDGFGSVKVADYGTDLTQTPTDKTSTAWVVRVSGAGGSSGWFTDARNGVATPAANSPLRGAGVPVSPAYQDFSGTVFSATEPDIGSISYGYGT